MLEKSRRQEKREKGNIRDEVATDITSFETFYQKELTSEAFRTKGREYKMNPEDYAPKKFLDKAKLNETFQNSKEREASFFSDFEIYKENRCKDFFIL